MPLANPDVAVAATQMEILTMATKKKSTARKPKARSVTKSMKLKWKRVEGAIGALDEVLTGLGAERADRIRERVRSILNSFK